MKASYLKPETPTNPQQWKKWKEEKTTQKRKWNEEKLLKEMEKAQKKKAKLEKTDLNSQPQKNGRLYTVSIALPGSILDNAQSPELRTYLAGQIARAAVVFNVDEIIIFDETGTTAKSTEGTYEGIGKHGNANVQLGRILQYLECPQYLRKSFFPKHKDLQYAGLLNPLDSPHHVRIDDLETPYREGVVLNVAVKGEASLVDVGLRKMCKINKKIQAGVRVTVRMKPEEESKKKHRGSVVSPQTPREEGSIYWGYNVRLASSLGTVFTQSPFKGGYDVCVGTSERGVNVDQCNVPNFSHMLVVFGGLKGLEASLDVDKDLTQDDPQDLFDLYLNTCPSQGSNTIRTEEAILVTMSILRPHIQRNCVNNVTAKTSSSTL